MVRLEIGQTKLVIIALVQLLQASVHRHRAVDAGLTLADPSKVRPVNDLYPHSLFRGVFLLSSYLCKDKLKILTF